MLGAGGSDALGTGDLASSKENGVVVFFMEVDWKGRNKTKRLMGKCLTLVTLWCLFGRYLSLVLLILNEFFEAVKCPSGYHGLQRKRCPAF